MLLNCTKQRKQTYVKDCFVAHNVSHFIQIIEELLAMKDDLIYREMGKDGGSAAIPSHLSSRRIPPVIARSLA